MREPSFILQILGMIIVIWYLGNYAIRKGQRIERQKKFNKNMKNYDDKRKNN